MKTILKKFATFLCAALVLCACSDDDYSEAHQSLMALIRQAESLVEESTEGIEEGDTAPGSKKALQARIDQAYYIMNNTSRDEGYRNACKQLEEAIKAFRENIVKAGIPYFNAGSKMNLGPAGDWDLTEELTWEMKIRFDEFAAGDQNVISCEQGKGAIMIRNNGANLQFYVNDGSWKGGPAEGDDGLSCAARDSQFEKEALLPRRGCFRFWPLLPDGFSAAHGSRSRRRRFS